MSVIADDKIYVFCDIEPILKNLAITPVHHFFKFSALSDKQVIVYLKLLDILPVVDFYDTLYQTFIRAICNLASEYWTGKIEEFDKNQICSLLQDNKIADALIKRKPEFIQFIENPSKDLQYIAVKSNGLIIRYINHPSIEIQKFALKQDIHSLKVIKCPSEEIKEFAIRLNAFQIKWFENPSEELKRIAVQIDGCSIKFIKNPSEEIQILAVRNNPTSIKFIDNPSENVIRMIKLDT